MNYQALFARILDTVDTEAYRTPSAHVDATQRAAMSQVERAIQAPDFDAAQVRRLIDRLFSDGHIDAVLRYSALHVVACHPRVADWEEAARLAGAQEHAALELGGRNLQANLASVDRHRGVLAFLRSHFEVALDYFARALERQRSAENLGNILATLVRLGDEDEAADLLRRVRAGFPQRLVDEVDTLVDTDPDLALLRS
ncbi:MAG: tetratricopeptide (TPR) repeat protein [Myxococcota bacterium]|jgi:tetratricopeptide (TPR) repeat protein